MFYPIFSGWTQETVPLFKHPSEALCWQLSRFFKDSICHPWPHDQYPKWMHFIGGLRLDTENSDPSSLAEYKIKFASSIESYFFDNVIFSQYTGASRASTILLECDEVLFSLCRSLFKTHPDYQSSSGSIFGYKSRCSSVLGKGNVFIPVNSDGIPRPRCSNNLINIGYSTKGHEKLRSASDIGTLLMVFIRLKNFNCLIFIVYLFRSDFRDYS